jgi:anti-sigma B factor antagonist
MSSFYIGDGTTGDGVVVLVVAGEIDYAASPQLKERILAHLNADRQHLVLDLSSATFIDSTAIGVLTGAANKLHKADGGSLAIVCTHEKVLQIFVISGLESIISLYSSCEEAISALAVAG